MNNLYINFENKLKKVISEMEKIRSIRVISGYRDAREQERIYAQGRTLPGKIISYAKPWQSMHNYGLAADVCFIGNDPYLEKIPKEKSIVLWSEFGRIAKNNGLVWGGDFTSLKDFPHVEYNIKKNFELWKKIIIEKGIKELHSFFIREGY